MKRWMMTLLWLGSAGVGYAQEIPNLFARSFTSQTELGVQIGRVVIGQAQQQSEVMQQQAGLTFQTFNGVQLTPRLAVGATVGADWYSNILLMPLGGGVRYMITRKALKSVRVYAGLDAGYATDWLAKDLNGSNLSGGAFASPTLGLRMGRLNRSNLTLSFSYRHQQASIVYQPDSFYLLRSEKREYNRVAVRLGVAF